MERHDNHSVFGESSEVRQIPLRNSVRFKLLMLGILLILYDLVFLSLYLHSSFSYAEHIRAIMDAQKEYQERYQDLEDNLRALNNYIDTNGSDDLMRCYSNSRRLAEFAEFLQGEDAGPYAYDLGEMVKSYRRYSDEVIQAVKKQRQASDLAEANQEVLAAFAEVQRSDRLIVTYANYTVREMQDGASARLEALYGAMKRQLYLLLLSFVAVTSLVVGVVIRKIRRILNPIRQLTDLIGETSLGEWKMPPCACGRQDEMGLLLRAFCEMQSKIAGQYEELVRSQRLEKQLLEEEEKTSRARAAVYRTRLQVFQSQINSHFLFNALNIVGRLAYTEGAPRTREAALLIASFFRTVLNQFNRVVTLSEEFIRVGEYLDIQKLRFGERIRVDIECDPDLEQLRIPSMVLQPLVENAFAHGVAGKEHGYIRCVGETRGKDGLVYVWDDGGNLTSAKRQELLDMLSSLGNGEETEREFHEKQQRQHIGLRNVFERLHLKFGDGVEPIIEAEEGGYTQIGFRFLDILDESGEIQARDAGMEEAGKRRS